MMTVSFTKLAVICLFFHLSLCAAQQPFQASPCRPINNDSLINNDKALDKTDYPADETRTFFNTINDNILDQIALLSNCQRLLTKTSSAELLSLYVDNWYNWVSLIKLRNHVISKLADKTKNNARGFGITGVAQATLESRAILFAIQHAHLEWVIAIARFFSNVSITPIPLFILCLHIVLLVLFYLLWRRKGVKYLKKLIIDTDNRWIKAAIAIYLKARNPIDILIILSCLKSILYEIYPSWIHKLIA